MHSGIRILCLLIFCTVLSYRGEQALPAAVLLVLCLMLLTGLHRIVAALPMLRRLKYFYLSLLVLYLWFTPGRPLVEAWGALSPSLEGMRQASARLGILVLIVLAVNLLLQTTSREQLLGGILWLVRPLARFGLAGERLAVRMVLVLQLLEQRPAAATAVPRSGKGIAAMVDQVGRRIALRYRETLDRAEALTPTVLTVPAPAPVPPWQWLFPLLLLALFRIDAAVVF